VRRLEDADEPAVEDLGDAVAADRRVGCHHVAEPEAVQPRSVQRRPVQNGDSCAAGRQDRLHPDRDGIALSHSRQ